LIGYREIEKDDSIEVYRGGRRIATIQKENKVMSEEWKEKHITYTS
jgi:hypothetical protein